MVPQPRRGTIWLLLVVGCIATTYINLILFQSSLLGTHGLASKILSAIRPRLKLGADCREPARPTFGLVFITYSDEAAQVVKFNGMVLLSAATYRLWSPDLSITLLTTSSNATTADGTSTEIHKSLINRVVMIPPDFLTGGRQWLTRILALTLSPYEVTLVVDSDTFCCGSTGGLFEQFILSGFDFAVGSHSPAGEDIYPDNGVFMYRRSEGFFKLMALWELHQMTAGATMDDQATLKNALLGTIHTAGVKAAQILPRAQMRFIPAQGEPWVGLERMHDTTMVVTDNITIAHMWGLVGKHELVCTAFNRDAPRTRAFVYDHNNYSWQLLYSGPFTEYDRAFVPVFDEESCNLKLNATCRNLGWTPKKDSYFVPIREAKTGRLVAAVSR